MSDVDEAIAMAEDLFSGVAGLSARKMFGGAGLYADGVIFAVIVDGALMLKADSKTGPGQALIAALEAEGAERWRYDGKKKPVAMPYWRLPDAALDDSDAATAWAQRAIAALGA